MSESTERRCEQCGATLLPKWRFCVACSAPIPGAERRPQGQLAETLRHLPSTRQPDKTLVFVPELREARLKRSRRNKLIGIIVAVGCVALVITGFSLLRVKEHKKAQLPQQQREKMARHDLELYGRAFENFHADVGRYPTATEGLPALLKQPPTLAHWRGPYIEADYSVDPWGHDYVYQAFNNGAAYAMYTYGPEGESAGHYFLQINSGAQEPSAVPKP